MAIHTYYSRGCRWLFPWAGGPLQVVASCPPEWANRMVPLSLHSLRDGAKTALLKAPLCLTCPLSHPAPVASSQDPPVSPPPSCIIQGITSEALLPGNWTKTPTGTFLGSSRAVNHSRLRSLYGVSEHQLLSRNGSWQKGWEGKADKLYATSLLCCGTDLSVASGVLRACLKFCCLFFAEQVFIAVYSF